MANEGKTTEGAPATADLADDVDRTIEQIERLYASLVGREPPPMGEEPEAPIPPEQDPQRYVEGQLDRMFQLLTPLSPSLQREGQAPEKWSPRGVFLEGPATYFLHVDLPGVPEDSVDVSASGGNVIVISGERPARDTLEAQLRWSESPTGGFERAIQMPPEARPEQLEARLERGVLQIDVPKAAANKIRLDAR